MDRQTALNTIRDAINTYQKKPDSGRQANFIAQELFELTIEACSVLHPPGQQDPILDSDTLLIEELAQLLIKYGDLPSAKAVLGGLVPSAGLQKLIDDTLFHQLNDHY